MPARPLFRHASKAGEVVVMGGSAGAIEPLLLIVRALPPDFPTPIFVVVHMSAILPSLLPDLLSGCKTVPVIAAEDDTEIHENRIYVAVPDRQLEVGNSHVHLTRGPKENRHRPAIDPLFRSAAMAYGSRVVGVLLSGMLDDGVAGLHAIKREGGTSIVQSPRSAQQPSMPEAAIRFAQPDYILAPAEIAPTLVKLQERSYERSETGSHQKHR